MKKGLLSRYPIEIFVILNAVAVHLLLLATGTILGAVSLLDTAFGSGTVFVVSCALGIAIRSIVDRQSESMPYRAHLRGRGWRIETLRVIALLTLAMHGYVFLKLFVPLINTHLYDQQLAALDQALFGGLNASALVLNLFATPAFTSFIDWSYLWIFAGTVMVSCGYFLSSPDREKRLRFVWGFAIMWVAAAWLYLAIPSFGPIYFFEEIWREAGVSLPQSRYVQTLVMKNYTMVLKVPTGVVDPELQTAFGLAAFPSMHVGMHFFIFLWTRGTNRAARFVFGLFVLLIALGSVITGWHYLIDSLGGALVAWVAYTISLRYPRGPLSEDAPRHRGENAPSSMPTAAAG